MCKNLAVPYRQLAYPVFYGEPDNDRRNNRADEQSHLLIFWRSPTIYPVLRSCEVAPAFAEAIQIIPPTTSTMGSYVFPLQPIPINTRQVAITVAMVIPLIGLLLDPIMPTILEDTVTKKAPNITTSMPSNNLLPYTIAGIIGIKAMSNINATLPKVRSLY